MGLSRIAALLVAILVPGWTEAAPCRSVVVDSLSVHAVAGHPVVTVTVDGEPVSMLLDTGAEISAVTPALAARLGLRVARGGPDTATGIGDGTGRPVAVTDAVVGLTGRGVRRRLLVLDLPGAPGDVAGLAGVDVLSDFDLDLDQVEGQLTLRRAGASCRVADPPPWPGLPAVRLDAGFTPRRRITVPVRFGPVAVQALLDTGVDGPVMTREAAGRAGMTEEAWAAGERASFVGVGLRAVTVRTVRLGDAGVGGEQVGTVAVAVPEGGLPGAEMLLGNDWVAAHRVLISWTRQAVWVRRSAARKATAHAIVSPPSTVTVEPVT